MSNEDGSLQLRTCCSLKVAVSELLSSFLSAPLPPCMKGVVLTSYYRRVQREGPVEYKSSNGESVLRTKSDRTKIRQYDDEQQMAGHVD